MYQHLLSQWKMFFFSFLSQSISQCDCCDGSNVRKENWSSQVFSRRLPCHQLTIIFHIGCRYWSMQPLFIERFLNFLVWQAREKGISWFPSWNCEKLLCNWLMQIMQYFSNWWTVWLDDGDWLSRLFFVCVYFFFVVSGLFILISWSKV